MKVLPDGFIEPMLASKLPEDDAKLPDLASGRWVAEEKYDGHRIIVRIDDAPTDLLSTRGIRAWTREPNPRALPTHIRRVLHENFPNCVLDGELLAPGKRSYGTGALVNVSNLVYVVFDILEVAGHTTAGLTYDARRELFGPIYDRLSRLGKNGGQGAVIFAPVYSIESWDDVRALRAQVWERDGEGLILKRRDALYRPGKRSQDWIKVKKCQSALLTVVDFLPGKMGPRSRLVLEDDDGNRTRVKWKNLEQLRLMTEQGDRWVAEGRKLWIEFQERTPSGSYRGPVIWDRWEDE